MLGQWWLDHEQDIPDPKILPHDGTGGFIVNIDGTDVVAGYLYFTNASIAYIDFLISKIVASLSKLYFLIIVLVSFTKII